MKKNILAFISFLIMVIVLSAVILDTSYFFNMIVDTLYIWLYKVFGSIFIFYIISSIIIHFNLSKFIFYPLIKITPFIKFETSKAKEIFFISILVGNPSSASLIKESYYNKSITYNDANNLIKISSFINPLFIISSLSVFEFKISFIILFCHIFSNFIIALFVLNKNQTSNNEIQKISLNIKLSYIINSIQNAISLLLFIAGVMVFFNCIKYSIKYYVNNQTVNIILSSLEVSSGIFEIIELNKQPIICYSLISFLLGFSSFSIIFQVYNIIGDTTLSFKKYFIFRIIQGIIATLMTIIFIKLLL